jgi:hypothetical protein
MKKQTPNNKNGKDDARPIFDSIRKPLAPPSHALSQAKPEDRAHPAKRKTKHKQPAGDME